MSRDEQAAVLVSAAISAGRILKSFGPDGDYTVGPYQTATGPSAFALFGYGTQVPATYQQRQGAALDVARAFVSCVGSGRALAAARAQQSPDPIRVDGSEVELFATRTAAAAGARAIGWPVGCATKVRTWSHVVWALGTGIALDPHTGGIFASRQWYAELLASRAVDP